MGRRTPRGAGAPPTRVADDPGAMAERVLCVVPALEHAHYSRRAAMLRDAGFQVSVIGFERAGRPGGRLDCPVESLGALARGRYLKRALVLGGAVRRVRAALRRHDLAYAFGPDLGALALFAARRTGIPIVLEVPDLRPRQTASGGLARIARALDRALVERCRLLVLTSADYETYYRTWLRTGTPRLVVENKVDPAIAAAFGEPSPDEPLPESPQSSRPTGRLRLGWFGLLRDEWSLRLLEILGRTAPDRFEFSLAGAFAPVVPDFPKRVSAVPNLVYHGPFRREEAPALFAGADLTLSCYPPDPPHWRWSRSNRYYLACLCRTPLITRAGTADAAETERWDIGVSLREETPERAAAALARFAARRLVRDDLRRFRANMARLPRDHYVATEEPERLRRALAALSDGSGEA